MSMPAYNVESSVLRNVVPELFIGIFMALSTLVPQFLTIKSHHICEGQEAHFGITALDWDSGDTGYNPNSQLYSAYGSHFCASETSSLKCHISVW